jgi:hypothetical protein
MSKERFLKNAVFKTRFFTAQDIMEEPLSEFGPVGAINLTKRHSESNQSWNF